MKCPDCGREMSDRSVWTRCPSCGCPMEAITSSHKFKAKLNNYLWGLGILFFLIIAFCSDDKDKKEGMNPSKESTEKVQTEHKTKNSTKKHSKTSTTIKSANSDIPKTQVEVVSEPLEINREEITEEIIPATQDSEVKEDVLELPAFVDNPSVED